MLHAVVDKNRDIIRDLISSITGLEVTSKQFKHVEESAYAQLAKPSYNMQQNRRTIEQTINGLCEKFRSHGCFNQAKYLEDLTKSLFENAKTEEETEVRINVIKLILELSKSPTRYFFENPETFKVKFVDTTKKEFIDWGEYLKDTKVKLKDNYEEVSSDDFSDDSEYERDEISESVQIQKEQTCSATIVPETLPLKKVNLKDEAKQASNILSNSIQNSWWNQSCYIENPLSKHRYATLTLDWKKYVETESSGLLEPQTSIISEYKVIRELLWQFFEPVNSFVFKYENEIVTVKPNITINSVLPSTFKTFFEEFVPYINMLNTFREFQKSLLSDYFVVSIPETYRSYCCGIEEILKPIYDNLVSLEDIVRKQEEVVTLLSVGQHLRIVFKDVKLLYEIHTELMQGYVEDDAFKSATDLMSRLYYGLLNSSNKTEFDIYLTLYLHCLYKYINTIEIWLTQDIISDPTAEFVIIDKNTPDEEHWKMKYIVRKLQEFSAEDTMLNLMAEKILPLGKNFHLLHLLGKLHVVVREEDTEFLHRDFVQKVLEEIERFSKTQNTDEETCKEVEIVPNEKNNDQLLEPVKKLVNICPEVKPSQNKSDSLSNFLDFSDDFLATVFEPFLYQVENTQEDRTKSLYKTICETTTSLFPIKCILENTFTQILEKRFSVPGLLVKSILISDFSLKKYFNLLRNIYLFENDLLYPLHKKMFTQFYTGQTWGNFYWLTSQLQDLLMDQYSDFYQDCRIDVDPLWKICTDPVKAFDLVKIICKIHWPINIIIQQSQMIKYQEIFQFILKVKWAMHTLHSLSFTDVEPKNKTLKSQPSLIRERIRKLELMRFWLLNIVTSIHHYVLGHLYSLLYRKFSKDFEECDDFESLRDAHDKFISSIHAFCKKLRDEMKDSYGFYKILSLVSKLHNMWNNIKDINDQLLESYSIQYRSCYKFLRPIIELDVASIH